MASRRPKPGESGNSTASPLPPIRRDSKQSLTASSNPRRSTDETSTSNAEPGGFHRGDDPTKPRKPSHEGAKDTNQYKQSPSTEFEKHFTHASSRGGTTEKKTTTTTTKPQLHKSQSPLLTTAEPVERSQPLVSQSPQVSTNTDALKQQPRLTPLLMDFLKIPLGDYKVCERFCKDNPAIWHEDVSELRKFSNRYLNEGRHENARRCAERWWIITSARHQELTATEANAYVKDLIKDDDDFQLQLDQILIKLGQDVGGSSSVVPDPPAKVNLQPPPSTVVPVRSKRGPSVGSAVVFPQSVGNTHVQKLTRRASDALSQQPPKLLPPSTTTDERQHLARRSGSENPYGAPDPEADGDDTIVDNITVHNREQPIQITGQEPEAGPNLDLFDDDFKDRDVLYNSFQLRVNRAAQEFFVKGRVFAMVWHENAGSPAHPRRTETSESLDRPFHRHTLNKDGIVIFSHIRHFVIVKARPRDRYCWSIPINTYGGYGLTKKNMRMEEKQAHAIIHASNKDPVRIKGEVKLNKQPIAVEMAEGEVLKPASRLHFGKMQSIEWNIKVKNIGMITNPVSVRRLNLYFNREVSKGDDTGTETEAGPSRSTGAPQQR